MDELQTLADRFGTPCFVYDMDEVDRRIETLRACFGGRFRISYAVKSNPNHALLERLAQRIEWLDISSGGELLRARAAGWPADRISFTGPAKRDAELRQTVEHGIGHCVVESVDEAERLDRIASEAGRRQTVLARIGPSRLPRGFGINMSGKPTQFGIDEEDADRAVARILELPSLSLEGFHIYSGTQCLDAEAVAENFENFIELFRGLAERHGLSPKCLIFGSGMGIPYHENQQPLDVARVGERINPHLDELTAQPAFAAATLTLELGRWIIGPAGTYLTRIVRIKQSRGTAIGLCDGGMNHHLGAAGHLGSVIHRNYRIFKVGADAAAEPVAYDLVGPLCTSIDAVGHRVSLPPLAAGDVLGIENSGAYGVTASPIHFISHPTPREVIAETRDGQRTFEEVGFDAPGSAQGAGTCQGSTTKD